MNERVKVTGYKPRQADATPQAWPGQQQSGPRPRPLELHIEELVLNGFNPRDRHGIGDAIERELAMSLGENGFDAVSLRNLELSDLDAGVFKANPADRPGRTGREISRLLARAIHRNLGRHDK